MLSYVKAKLAKTPGAAQRAAPATSRKPERVAALGLDMLFDLKLLRERLLSELTELADQSMRSPAFLTFLRYSLMITNHAQLLWAGRPARHVAGVPMASDPPRSSFS